jgi:hypothetical protein
MSKAISRPSFRRSSDSQVGFLTEGFGVEGSELFIFHSKTYLNWFAAYLAVFDIGLTTDGQVQEHRNLFTAIWAVKLVFHSAPGMGFPLA